MTYPNDEAFIIQERNNHSQQSFRSCSSYSRHKNVMIPQEIDINPMRLLTRKCTFLRYQNIIQMILQSSRFIFRGVVASKHSICKRHELSMTRPIQSNYNSYKQSAKNVLMNSSQFTKFFYSTSRIHLFPAHSEFIYRQQEHKKRTYGTANTICDSTYYCEHIHREHPLVS